MIYFINTILVMLFILSILNIIRNGYLVLQSFMIQQKHFISKTELFLLGLSISYFITALFNGLTI
jgi:hypothetical protein